MKKNTINEEIDGMRVIRALLPFVKRHQTFRRGIEHFEISNKLQKTGIKSLNQVDIALVYSPPLTLYKTSVNLGNKLFFPTILNVQDLFPQSVIDLGKINNKVLIKILSYMEKKAYKVVDLITVHSERNAQYIKSIIKDGGEKVKIIENWVNIDEVGLGKKKNNFSGRYSLCDKFVVSFAGTLGYSQDIEVIIKAANMTKDKDIYYLIVGDRVRFNEVQEKIKEYKLNNIIQLPTVPKEIYPQVLHSSDISLVTLKKEVQTPVVPSKILNIMSAAIPVLGTMNLNGDAPKLVKNANAGYIFPAGDYVQLANSILNLYKNPEIRKKLGKNGRKFIETNHSVEAAADNYEMTFSRVINKYKKKGAGRWKNT
jgi:colanic acid biosynthesis glycosyl transferase WcaI